MLKFRLAAIAVLVAVFGLLSVSSASAQYAPCSIELDVDPDSLEGAGSVDGEASSDVPGEWTASNDFNGQTDNGSGNTFNFSFSFPEVDDETEVTITVLLVREDNVTCAASETITLGGEDDDDDDGDGDGDEDKRRRPARHRRVRPDHHPRGPRRSCSSAEAWSTSRVAGTKTLPDGRT